MARRRDPDIRAPTAALGVTVASLMTSPPVVMAAEITSADAVHQLGRRGHDAYPVVGHDGRVVGLLRTSELGRAFHDSYATLVMQITDRDPGLFVEPWVDAGDLIDRAAFVRAHHAVVIDRDRRPVGIVSESDIVHALEEAG